MFSECDIWTLTLTIMFDYVLYLLSNDLTIFWNPNTGWPCFDLQWPRTS